MLSVDDGESAVIHCLEGCAHAGASDKQRPPVSRSPPGGSGGVTGASEASGQHSMSPQPQEVEVAGSWLQQLAAVAAGATISRQSSRMIQRTFTLKTLAPQQE